MLDQKLAEAMQRVLGKQDERANLTATMQRLVDEFDIGTARGKSIYFSAKDRDEMRALLEARGYAPERVNLVGMTRSERLTLTPNEKAGGEAVKRNRVSIKALPGHPLRIAGRLLALPHECHIDANWTSIADTLAHSCVLVVENYENFNRLHETIFDLPAPYSDPLVLYRGDPQESRADNVSRLLEHLECAVLAFPDADPAGLALAAALPRLAGVTLPTIETLDVQLADPKTARNDLFYDQFPVYRQALDSLPPEHSCTSAWRLLKKHKTGLTQERWLGPDTRIVLHPHQHRLVPNA